MSGEEARAAAMLERALPGSKADPVDLPDGALLNMELSNLAFQERVLDLAADPSRPLLERVRFLAIVGGNLDEFFMTRVAGFKQQVALGNEKPTLDGLSPETQLELVDARVEEILGRAYAEVLPELLDALAAEGIELLRYVALAPADREYLERNYVAELEAVLTPLTVAPHGAFPHVRNLRPALFVRCRGPEGGEESAAIVTLPDELPRLVPLPGGRRFVPLEDVVRAYLPHLFQGREIVDAHLFRVTRSGNLGLDEKVEDVLAAVAETIARRPFQPVVRIEVEPAIAPEVREILVTRLGEEAAARASVLGRRDLFAARGILDLDRLQEIARLPISRLRYPSKRRRSPFGTNRTIVEQLAADDMLVRFPAHSFERTVERFVREAANDPAVEEIRITLYRTSRSSRIVKLLQRAHANGKRVVALIEVKASFDERRNIEWARALEAAGIHVLYGPAFLKVHAKIAAVVRREGERRRFYSYVGTGNLNAATAAAYTDLGLFTADQAIGRELDDLFAALAGERDAPELQELIVAPFNMRTRFLGLIEREAEHARAGRRGEMTIKLNGIADREMVAALYRASLAGVSIDLRVRGICVLRPGVPGLSENIRVTGLVGRDLQHSRIFRFRNGGDPVYLIGSADWRGRNLSRRVEVVAPVHGARQRAALDRILEAEASSPDLWELGADGRYTRRGRAGATADPRAGGIGWPD